MYMINNETTKYNGGLAYKMFFGDFGWTVLATGLALNRSTTMYFDNKYEALAYYNAL